VDPRADLPRTVREVVDDAFRLYRASFSATWPLALAAELCCEAPVHLWQSRAQAALAEGPAAAAALLATPALWLTCAGAAVLFLTCYTALIFAINSRVIGSPVRASQALVRGVALLPRALVSGVLTVLIVTAGSLLLVVPGIYWAGALQLALVALAAEDIGGVASLTASRLLVKGHWWRATTVLSAVVVIAMLAALLFDLITGIAIGVFGGGAAFACAEISTLAQGTWLMGVLAAGLVATYHELRR
jgi:hypothetical protein